MTDWTYSGLDISVDYAGTKNGLYFVSNNVWNIGSLVYGKDFTQKIIYTQSLLPNGTTFSWDWGSSTEIRSYPEVIWGAKFENGSTEKSVKVSNLLGLNATYNFSMSGDVSHFNVAFSIWTQSQPGGTFDTVRTENMIWVHSNGWKPSPSSLYTTADGSRANMYINSNWGDHSGVHPNGWSYSATIFQQDKLAGTLDLASILKELIWRGAISPDDYISGVELGTEIAGGQGTFKINSLSYDLTSKQTVPVSGTYVAKAVGSNFVVGSTGSDTVVYSEKISSLEIERVSGNIYVRKIGSPGTLDIFTNLEHLKFADFSLNTTMKTEAAKLPTTTVNAIVELYVAYFARTPDASGLSYWIDKAAAGETLTAISKEFYNAGVQFSSLTGYSATMANNDFTKMIYANVLGRTGATAPNADELGYWDNRIKTGLTTKEGLIQKMLSDAHSFAGDPKWGWVPKLLDNKISVGYQAAVTYGLDYNSSSDAITQGMAIAKAVTPTDTSIAVGLIGLADHVFL